MQVANFKIEQKSRSDRFDFIFMGDIHAGSASFARDYFERMIDWLSDQETYYVIGMGDYMENTPPDHKNFDFEHVDRDLLTTEDQYQYILEQFGKIKSRIVGLIEGEHDERTTPLTGHSWVRHLCHELECPYLGESAFFRITFQRINERRSWDFYVCHGRYSGRTFGGAMNKIISLGNDWNADVLAMGGTHFMGMTTLPRMELNNNCNLVKRRRAFLLTGTYLESYQENVTSYAEQKQYSPQKVGSPKVKIWPTSGDLHVSE